MNNYQQTFQSNKLSTPVPIYDEKLVPNVPANEKPLPKLMFHQEHFKERLNVASQTMFSPIF
jgi:hypothetical protein